jgi:hypothetical protein
MNRRQVVALGAALPIASARVTAQDTDPVVALVVGWLAMFDSRDFSQVETLISPDYRSLYPSETSKQGRDALIERFQSDTAWDAFTTRSSQPISIAVDGDLVHVLAEISVTTEDGVAAIIPWLFVLRVQNGLITAGTGTVDREYLSDLLGP